MDQLIFYLLLSFDSCKSNCESRALEENKDQAIKDDFTNQDSWSQSQMLLRAPLATGLDC